MRGPILQIRKEFATRIGILQKISMFFFFFPGLKGWYLCGKPINHQECTHKCWPFWCVPPSHFWDQHVHASPFLDQRTDWKDMLYNCVPTFAVVRLHLHRFYTQNSPLFSQKKIHKTNKPYKRFLISFHVFLPIKRNQDINHQMIRCVCFLLEVYSKSQRVTNVVNSINQIFGDGLCNPWELWCWICFMALGLPH